MTHSIQELLQTRDWLLADGATGSNLFEVGLMSGDAPELWNIDHPDRIANLHQSFIDAGSDIVLTNTFGGTRYRLKLHQAQDRVKELNHAAVKIARGQADKAGRPVLVAGSMGPTGEILEPVGPVSIQEAQDAFKEQADALAQAGADVLWIETLSSEQEIEAAVNAAVSTGLPVVCTLSFDTNGRTMMGIAPGMFAQLDSANHLFACGANCGVGPGETVAGILNLANAATPQTVMVAKANCGIPNYVDGRLEYDGTPELMAEYARLAIDAGARIVGGCCGTSPTHVKAMHSALQSHQKRTPPTAQTLIAALGEISTGAQAQLDGKMTRAEGSASGNAPKKRRRKSMCSENDSKASSGSRGRRRGSGRAAKLAQRAATSVHTVPYIKRAIPNFELVDTAGLEQIEANADKILLETGIDFRDDPDALKLFRDAGADVDGDRVRFPVGLCRKIITENAPKQFHHLFAIWMVDDVTPPSKTSVILSNSRT